MNNAKQLAKSLKLQLSSLAVNSGKLTVSEVTTKLTEINQTHTQLYFSAEPETRMQDLLG
jgi:hypothetical protein